MRKYRADKILIGLFLVAIACSNTGIRKTNDLPYPPLTKQRALLANKPFVQPTRILDSVQVITDLIFLASDTCQGRAPGSAGHLLAGERVLQRMRSAGADSFNNALLQRVNGRLLNGSDEIRNIIGWVKGKKHPGKFIVISAHYDHEGIKRGKTYYGADDNASGVACLLALAKYYKEHPHDYSLVFAAFDREETGLEGAFAFTRSFSAEKGADNIVLNLNLDMIARSDKNEIFACGLSHYPQNKYMVDKVQDKVNVRLLMGHDTGNNMDDWTMQSDHAAFHKLKIPFLYIGVEDHPDYHKPTDKIDKINFSRYIENCNMIALMIDAYE